MVWRYFILVFRCGRGRDVAEVRASLQPVVLVDRAAPKPECARVSVEQRTDPARGPAVQEACNRGVRAETEKEGNPMLESLAVVVVLPRFMEAPCA
jgi:hypothetical protein